MAMFYVITVDLLHELYSQTLGFFHIFKITLYTPFVWVCDKSYDKICPVNAVFSRALTAVHC